jgi:uncharacterized protein (TIGR03435 family)
LAALAALSPVAAWARQAEPLTFAAVSIKPTTQRSAATVRSDPAGLRLSTYTLRQAIVYAYAIHDYQLEGGGEAMRSRSWTQFWHFDLDATTSAPATDAQLRAMLRNALKDRFGLALRQHTKPTTVQALVVAPGGIKFKPWDDGVGTPPPPGTRPLRAVTAAGLVSMLNTIRLIQWRWWPLKGTVIDQTGLTGRYRISVPLPADDVRLPNGVHGFQWHLSELPEALKEIGLELRPETMPLATYTIESAHEPTAN